MILGGQNNLLISKLAYVAYDGFSLIYLGLDCTVSANQCKCQFI